MPLPHDASRRHFIQAAVTGAVAGSGLIAMPGLVRADGSTLKTPSGMFTEPQRDIPINTDADVIVCGGGPAGIAAAITAARAGAKTYLFELHGCLGGVWTAGLLTWLFDFHRPGLTQELTTKLEERGARRGTNTSHYVYEPEEMKLLLEDLCTEAGVKFRLFTRVAAAYKENNRLTTIVTESKAGREAFRAPVFIDATGDGDLGALAGCGWDIGHDKDCPCQPMTLNALAAVKDIEKLKDYVSFFGGAGFETHIPSTKRFKEEIRKVGLEPTYGDPTLFHVRDNVVMVMINHEYGVKPFDADGLTKATVHGRREVFDVVRSLRKSGGVWEGFQVVATAEQIGIRDGRRIHGRYKMDREDLIVGRKHLDSVVTPTFGVDIHAESNDLNKKAGAISHGGFKMKPYDIPLRALIAKDIDGLMMAGRCISGDYVSHASYRVTGNSVAMGEAAGMVSAIAAATKRMPHEVDWAEAKTKLLATGQR